MAGYLQRLREARARAASAPTRDWSGSFFWAGLALLGYIWLAVQLRPDGEPTHFHFVREEGAVTALSAILLSSAAALAFAAGVLARMGRRAGPWVWFVFATGLAFFALDEQLQFHETLGFWLNGVASRQGATLSWNDLLVIAYGVVAAPVVVILLPRLFSAPKVAGYLGVAFLMYALHTLVDSAVEPPVPWSVIVEESFKLFAGAALAAAMLAGLVAQVEVVDAAGAAARSGRRKK